MPDLKRGIGWLIFAAACGVALLFLVTAYCGRARAHDHSRPGLNDWYKSLRNKASSPCCDGPSVDAVHLADVDWESKDGRYRVRIDGEWVDVPDEALLDGPNRDGRTLVWPTWSNGKRAVRCFMPGSMS